MDKLIQDLRDALRSFVPAPRFTLAAVATLVTPMDLTALGGVSALLAAVALIAAAVPARRAASTDPVEALLHE